MNTSEANKHQQAELRLPVDALSEQLSVQIGDDLLRHYQLQGVDSLDRAGHELDHSLAPSHARQGFRIGSLGLMIAYEDGSELVDMPEIFHIPNVPDWFLGVMNLHGVVIPVVSLANYLAIDHNQGERQRLLVLDHGNEAIGVVIDGLPDRLHWTSEQLVSNSNTPKKLQGHVRHCCLIDDALWFDLDVASLCAMFEDSLNASF